ncbi:MAG TPA: M14 metallopeptidase family protein, partial [Vicinamibacterales bacterium]|nr:M14 metallopeptidase family protein [Vicinamibacterales bacterium]
AQTQSRAAVTAPRDAFGTAIGDDYFLATYTQLEAYWKALDRESDRMRLVDIGRTEEGRTQWMAVLSAPENLARLDRYREIASRLARAESLTPDAARALAQEGKAVVWIDGGLHANEVLGAQQLIELVHQLASATDAETERILRDVVVLAVHANPDGHELVANWYMRASDPRKRSLAGLPRAYQKYVGHDNNRDFYLSSQAETRNMNRVLYREWFPQIVYNHHQSGPPGTVMFAPPFRDPFNYVFDPLIPASIDLVGAAMHARFAAEGKAGVTTRSGSAYSTWWNGGLRTTAYFHNQIGLLTEAIGDPTPAAIPFVPDRQLPSADLPFPIAPQVWHFRQSIDYSMSANRAVLDFASRYRETLLYNAYQMGRNAIERGSRDSWTASPRRVEMAKAGAGASGPPPVDAFERVFRDPQQRDARGYILPSDQPDFLTAGKFVGALLETGVSVLRATAGFTVQGRRYPAGSFVVKTAQAFRPHVLDMFEPQEHPNDVAYPGGPPVAPYDNAGWTLAYQMGVKFDRVLDGFDGPFEILTSAAPAPGAVRDVADAAGYLISHHQNDAFVAANRLLRAGADVYWPADRSAGGAATGTGAMFVAASSAVRPVLDAAAAQLGLVVTGVAARPRGAALRLRPARVALWDRYGGASSSGWIRWLLERYEFPFDVVYPRTLDEAGLASRFDVLILPSEAVPAGEGRRADGPFVPDDAPEEFRRRAGAITWARTVPRLKQFVEEGGTLVLIGGAAAIAERLGIGVADALVETQADGTRAALPRDRHYVPGSVMRVAVDNTAPLGYGFEREVDVFFDDSPAFRLDGAAGRRVAWYPNAAPLRSGWALGQRYLNGHAAAIDVPLGRGRVIVFGPEITYRAQSHGTFKFLFNAILYPRAERMAGL